MAMITVHVTADDIAAALADRGFQPRSQTCPVARAMTRRLRQPILVGSERWCNATTDYITGRLPTSARTFIARFDARHDVRPFAFQTEIEQ